MKSIFTKFNRIICPLLFVLCNIQGYAQNQFEEQSAKIFEQLDRSVLNKYVLLNKAMALESAIEPFRKKDKNKEGEVQYHIEQKQFTELIDLVERGDAADNKKNDAINKILIRKRDEVTKSNIIPISIVNSKAVLLTADQVQENIKAKEAGRLADTSQYEYFDIVAAGFLQPDVFQGAVQFHISKDLIVSNQNNVIEAIEIDFQDGKGWRQYKYEDQLIDYQFSSVGRIGIAIKLVTQNGTYITNCPFAVKSLERIDPDVQERIFVESGGARLSAEFFPGGEFGLYLGCDGVLDKPIIIAEGFDIGENVGISDIREKYFDYLSTFRNNGYDLILLNYAHSANFIQANAQVLKQLINTVKSRIAPTDSIIVVGESMSGLVARVALREMELAGQSHKVKLFIAFDTPNQGANIPPGLVGLFRALPLHLGWAAPILTILPHVRAMDTPAGRQMLLSHTPFNDPHPDYYIFKTFLSSLGNGGYPTNPKNIAMLNGSLAGAKQTDYNFANIITPGDRLLKMELHTWYGRFNMFAWSNKIDETTKVYEAISASLFTPFSYSVHFANKNINMDRLPGGYSFGYDKRFDLNPKFSFVPIHSSIDYKGTLNSDLDYNIITNTIINSANQVTNPNLTPFKAIYGRDYNTQHSFSEELRDAWDKLAFQELGLYSTMMSASCAVPPPPTAKVYGSRNRGDIYFGEIPSTLCKVPGDKYSTLSLYVPKPNPEDGFEQMIRITGNGTYAELRFGRGATVSWRFSALSPGTYTVSVIRQYIGIPSSAVITSSIVQIIECQNSGARVTECPTNTNSGELITILNDSDEGCYATYSGGVWIAALADGTFVPRSRLIDNGLTTSEAACFAEIDPINPAPASNCPDLGSITYERWENIGGGSTVEDLINGSNNFGNLPSVKQNLASFEAPQDVADNYGARMRGYVCAPLTGLYTFWISGDDNCDLWLSSDDTRENMVPIAYHLSWTSPRDWGGHQSQKSFFIHLQAGQKYYIEAWMKEGSGGDNLAVGWQLPNGALERPIPGYRLIPFTQTSTPPAPCGFTEKGVVGSKDGHEVQTRQYTANGVTGWYLVMAVPGSSVDKHFVKGANFAERTDIVWTNGPVDKTCLSGGDTGWYGMVKPEPLSVPTNYEQLTEPDGAIYFQQSSNQCTSPNPPTLSATSYNIITGQNTTITASNCSGNISWSTGATGTQITVSPSGTTTYTATCSLNGCTSSAATVTIVVSPPSSGVSCANAGGFLDIANCDWISGWAYDGSQPNTPIHVDIYDGGTLIQGNILANNYRSDLQSAGFGNGYHGYSIATPAALKNGQNHSISVKISDCNSSLANSPTMINCNSGSPRISNGSGVENSEAQKVDLSNVEINELTIYPNPTVTGHFAVGFSLDQYFSTVLTVTDYTGRIWYQKTVKGVGAFREEIKLNQAPAGTYMVYINTAKGIIVKKLTIVR